MTHQVQQLMDAMLDLQAAQASLLAVASSPLIMEEFHDHKPDVEEFLCVDGVTLI